MTTPQPLPGGAQPANVTLSGAGAGVASTGPTMVRQHWQLSAAAVKCSTNVAESVCSIYVGSTLSSATFMGATISGSTGDTIPLGGMDIQPGQQVFAQWSGGDAGATATLTVFGTYTTGAPKTPFLGALTGFINKYFPTFRAGNLIINKAGIFLYNGTPALGNPPFAFIKFSTVSVDPVGNPVLASRIAYFAPLGGSGQPSFGVNILGGSLFVPIASGAVSEHDPAQLTTQVFNAGTGNEQIGFAIFGPQGSDTTNDRVAIQMLDSSVNAPGIATLFLQYVSNALGTVEMLAIGAQGVSRYTPAGLNGGVGLTKMDSFARTVTVAVDTQISALYPIPAADAILANNQQTIYEIEAEGFGTWPNPTQALAFTLNFLGTTFALTISPGGTAGDGFNWSLKIRVVVLTGGSTGTVNVSFEHLIVRDASTGIGFYAGCTIDTNAHTVNILAGGNYFLSAHWQLGGAGATITCMHSFFHRIGT